MPPSRQSTANLGFTLIELLVVIAVFGLLSVVLGGGFRFAERAIAIGTGRVDRAGDLGLTDSFIRARLADARPLPDPAAKDAVLFDGAPDKVSFIGTPPAYLARGGFHAERLTIENRSGVRRLVFSAVPLDGEAAEPSSVLAEGIRSADFAYFGRVAANAPPAWHDRWSGEAGLPALIRLRLVFADDSVAPDLVVAVRPAGPAFR